MIVKIFSLKDKQISILYNKRVVYYYDITKGNYMFTKMKNKMNNMNWKDWLQVGLWLLTFALLISFVIVAATVTKETSSVETVKAHNVLPNIQGHGADATAALADMKSGNSDMFDAAGKLITKYDSFNAATGVTTHNVITTAVTTSEIAQTGTTGFWTLTSVVNIPQHDLIVIKGTENYADTVAAIGLVFGLTLFASILTTVFVKYLERGRKA